MANKLSKVLANSETNPFLEIARKTEEEIQANVKARKEAEAVKAAEPPKAEAPKKTRKPGPGRPKKEKTVKDTSSRISVYISNDLYDYWKEETERERTTMVAVINNLLKAEKERRESKDIN